MSPINNIESMSPKAKTQRNVKNYLNMFLMLNLKNGLIKKE